MLCYDEYGNRENPTILMLHGAGALDTFSRQYCFSEKYHLVVPHLPGAGKAADQVYEPEKTKQALYTLIAGLNKEKIGLIGHSLGGQRMGQSEAPNGSDVLRSGGRVFQNAPLGLAGSHSGKILELYGRSGEVYGGVFQTDHAPGL